MRRRRLIIVGIAIALLMISIVTYAVLVHRWHSSSAAPTRTKASSVEVTPAETKPVITNLPALPATSDPETFARLVAETLFAWDTATLITRTDQVEELVAVAVADPTGESTPGLVSDLGGYLPTQDAWVELAHYQTRQWLSIDSGDMSRNS